MKNIFLRQLTDVYKRQVFGRILSEAGYRKKRTPNGQVYGLYGTALTERCV